MSAVTCDYCHRKFTQVTGKEIYCPSCVERRLKDFEKWRAEKNERDKGNVR